MASKHLFETKICSASFEFDVWCDTAMCSLSWQENVVEENLACNNSPIMIAIKKYTDMMNITLLYNIKINENISEAQAFRSMG